MVNERKTFFISDLHLEASRPYITEKFLAFLKTEAKTAEALYILGDFFEQWIGDDCASPDDEIIIQALKEFHQTGIPVYFMQGNRDFHVGKHFAEASGCTLISDPYLISLYDHQVLLTHGDSLCTLDVWHQRYRGFVQNSFIKMLYLLLPKSLRSAIANGLRFTSKTKIKRNTQTSSITTQMPGTAYQRPAKYDVTETAVKKALLDHKATCLIHGHTHQAGIHHFSINNLPYKRIVLGEWGRKGSVLVCTKEKFYLKEI